MRRKVKIVYLALIAFSLVVIILFAVLLKGKLKVVKEVPTDPNMHHQFEENPRITLPQMENFPEGEDGENGFEDDGELGDDGEFEDDGEISNDEGEPPADSDQP